MNQLILTIITSAIIVPIVASFSKAYFDKVFAQNPPDTKKITTVMKNILFFILKYVLLIANIINLMIKVDSVTPVFVLALCMLFSTFTFIAIMDFLRIVFKDYAKAIASGMAKILIEKQILK
jgi:hypothetical protein